MEYAAVVKTSQQFTMEVEWNVRQWSKRHKTATFSQNVAHLQGSRGSAGPRNQENH